MEKKRPFLPCATTCPPNHTKLTEEAPPELLTHFPELPSMKYCNLSPIISLQLKMSQLKCPEEHVLNLRQPLF